LVLVTGERDFHLRGVGAVEAQVPQVGEPVRWLPADHLAPVVLGALGGALEDPPAGVRLEGIADSLEHPTLPLTWRSMPDLQPSFDQFAAGLKQQAEQAQREFTGSGGTGVSR